MTPEERTRKIEAYGQAPAVLVAALQELPLEAWQYRPGQGRWTIHEIVLHIADGEANSYLRSRFAIAEPGSAVVAYDEERWAVALDYHSRRIDEALELFRVLRLSTYRLIKTLEPAVWSQTIQHPQNGTMTLDDWLDVYVRHVDDHVAQMRENVAEWQKR